MIELNIVIAWLHELLGWKGPHSEARVAEWRAFWDLVYDELSDGDSDVVERAWLNHPDSVWQDVHP